ncbi:unnamed protein product, partial [Hymenolepis diminuta]
MDGKAAKKKPFWRLSKNKNRNSVEIPKADGSSGTPASPNASLPVNGTLRSLFMDDTAIVHRRSSLTDRANYTNGINPDIRLSQRRSNRECRSMCVPSGEERNFLLEIKNAGISMQVKTHDIHVWYQNQLYRVNRVFKENQTDEVEFLRKLYQIFLPKEPLPANITSAFQVVDEQKKSFRPIRNNELFPNGSLLKLLINKESNPRPGIDESCALSQQNSNSSNNSSASNNSSPPLIYPNNQFPDYLAAPLLARKYPTTSSSATAITALFQKQEVIEEVARNEKLISNHPSSPGSMHSQIPSGGTPTRLPIHSTLIPATMQVGSNGERHLILHYPDGHSVAATALPNQSGQFHLVPMISNHQSTSQTAQGQSTQPPTTLRIVQTASDLTHSKRQSNGESHTHLVRNKAGQKLELVCTCPPELHQAIRQSQIDGSHHNSRLAEDELVRRIKVSSRNHQGWINSIPIIEQHNIPSGESSETFQESDSSGGSGYGTTFSNYRQKVVLPDTLLNSVLNDQAKSHSKPPQTLEEAQLRIAQMESQLNKLTSWFRAIHTQGGMEFYASGQIPKNNDSNHCSDSYGQCSHSVSPPSHSSNRHRLLSAYRELKELRLDLQSLRETHAANTRQMQSLSDSVVKEISELLTTVQPNGATPVRAVQLKLDNQIADFKTGYEKIETWLADLDGCIEEMRIDALNRRCRVSVAEVEAYALHLSRLSQRLASFKGQIPEICNASNLLSLVIEAEIKLQNEYLSNEPKRIDVALSTCKQLTCTLFTLKRLAAVQEN